MVVVGSRHRDKAAEVGRTTDAQVKRLDAAIGLQHIDVSGAGPIDGKLVVTQAVVVARNGNVARLAERHGAKTGDCAEDGPHTSPWALIVKTAGSVGPLTSKLPTTGTLTFGVPNWTVVTTVGVFESFINQVAVLGW